MSTRASNDRPIIIGAIVIAVLLVLALIASLVNNLQSLLLRAGAPAGAVGDFGQLLFSAILIALLVGGAYLYVQLKTGP